MTIEVWPRRMNKQEKELPKKTEKHLTVAQKERFIKPQVIIDISKENPNLFKKIFLY